MKPISMVLLVIGVSPNFEKGYIMNIRDNFVGDGPFCPKCGYESGDSWTQCENGCPIKASPYFDVKVEYHYEEEMEKFYAKLYS